MAHPAHVYTGPTCPRCSGDLGRERRSGLVTCPSCQRTFEAAWFAPEELSGRVRQVSEAGPDGAAACVDHPANLAASECNRCGRFMCDLCRIDSDGQALCPPCYERLSAEGALASATTSFRDWRGLAGRLALFGVAVFFLAPALGPAAMYCAWRARQQKIEWGDEGGFVAVWVAGAVGLLEAVASVFLIVMMVRS